MPSSGETIDSSNMSIVTPDDGISAEIYIESFNCGFALILLVNHAKVLT
jgi:hypothetical protein